MYPYQLPEYIFQTQFAFLVRSAFGIHEYNSPRNTEIASFLFHLHFGPFFLDLQLSVHWALSFGYLTGLTKAQGEREFEIV